MDVSIAVPLYNEEDSILILHNRLNKVMLELNTAYEIIYVNDGSSDRTGVILDQIATSERNVLAVHFRRNFGQTSAMMAAIQKTKGEIVVTLDGDLQNDPADIPKLIGKIKEDYDVVSGWRKDRKEGIIRRWPSIVANWLVSRVTGVQLHDYGCTLKAYRGDMLRKIRLYGEMHRFIPIYAMQIGASITELTVKHHPRKYGKSKYGIGRIPRVILDIIVLRFLSKAMDRPIQFFGKIGIYAILLAFIFGVLTIYLKIVKDIDFILTPLPLLIALLFLTGMIFVMIGLLGEIQIRTYYEAQKRFPFEIDRTVGMD
ncbi:glycosyltransferase family 2 protein [bacterium]|jgi:glycosyltransferase involved in cell wall biosynthesis|nr:glycosyltransferase family 2 protein [bacterium]